VSYSALAGTNRVDYLRSKAYVFQDGRGAWLATDEAAASGGLAIFPLGRDRLQVIRVSDAGPWVLRRPFQTRGVVTECLVSGEDGQALPSPAYQDNGQETRFPPLPKGLRYVIQFGAQRRGADLSTSSK
jgi:hypothetical protein